MNIKTLGSFIFVLFITSTVLLGCGGGGKEEVYDIPEPVIVNIGSKYLKLDISLGVTNKKQASDDLPKILHEINQTFSTIDIKPEGLKQSDVAQMLEESLKNYGVKKVYFRTFVLQ